MAVDTAKWWAGLTVPQKERIASKVAGAPVAYPACTVVWNELTPEKQQKIHDHCVDSHGYFMKEWFEGNPFTD